MRALLERLDEKWVRLELVLASLVGGALVLSLSAWVVLKGLAAHTTSSFYAGAIVRATFGAVIVGVVAWRALARVAVRALLTFVAVLLGALLGVLFREVGVDWSANVLAWVQDGSVFTLAGGLNGLSTRLTLWLVFLGASLATSQGRHLSIDVVARLLPERLAPWTARLSGLFAALVCLVSAWGFFDFLAIDAFRSKLDDAPAVKVEQVASGVRRLLFFTGRQLSLDVKTAPRVALGTRWDTSLPAAEWNAWVDGSDWSGVVDATSLKENAAETRVPLIVTGAESPRGLVSKALALVVPFGLFVLALKFLLWVLRGARSDEAHGGAR